MGERLSRADAAWWHGWLRDFGATVRGLREVLGLSQGELAKIAGISQGAVSRIERGNALSTPLILGVKLRVALAARLRKLDADKLPAEAQRFLTQVDARYGPHAEPASPPYKSITFAMMPTSELTGLVLRYGRLSAADRARFRQIMSAVVTTLAADE